MHHAHRFDGVSAVGGEVGFNRRHIDAVAPVAANKFGYEAEPFGHVVPEGGELAGLAHQYAVARRQGVDQCGFPRPGAGGRIDHHWLLRTEHRFDVR